jgi:hypothetical protein
VLIGPRTYSAAQNFATRLERETFAIDVALEAALTDKTTDPSDDDRFAKYWERESQQGRWEPFWLAG